MLNWLFFFFIAFGSKLLLATAMIYLLFPDDRVCSECDAETLPVRMGALGRGVSRVMLGRLQRRWCPRCGWEGMTRTGRTPHPAHARAAGRGARVRP